MDLDGTDVLVTGGNGFIGSHLVRRLIAEGAKVTVILQTKDTGNLEGVEDRIRTKVADLTNAAKISKIVQKVNPQKVFHLAAYVSVDRTFENISKIIQSNIMGTMNLLQALDKSDYDCFINTGTCEEYGDNMAPFKEDQQMNPVSPYSASKASTTLFCRMYNKVLSCPIVTLRPFLTYGPYQKNSMLIPNTIINALHGKEIHTTPGEQTREFNYVEDIADGFIKASLSKKAIGEIINIGNGKEYKIKDVVQRILAIMGNPVKLHIGALPYREGEAMHFYCDNRKARKLLGWAPKTGLDEGLRKTIEWYESKLKKKELHRWMIKKI